MACGGTASPDVLVVSRGCARSAHAVGAAKVVCLAGQGCLQGPPCLQADAAQSRLHFVVGVKRSAEICCQAHEEGDLIMGRSHC